MTPAEYDIRKDHQPYGWPPLTLRFESDHYVVVRAPELLASELAFALEVEMGRGWRDARDIQGKIVLRRAW